MKKRSSLALASLLVQISTQAVAAKDVNSFPAPASTGPYSPIIESDASLPGFTIYRPDKIADQLPLAVWGNGACVAMGGMYRDFLSEIASHGYFVISLGAFGPDDVRTMKLPAAAPPKPGSPVALPKDFKAATTSEQMIEAIDWATKQNDDAGSRFHGEIDLSKIVVMGHSCGGLQALTASLDKRITTTVLLDSGAFKPGAPGIPGMDFTSDDIVKLHAPILYIEGGPTDIAYPQGKLNYENTKVPAAFINLDVGHGGTYAQPHGGAFATVTAAWLDWQLKSDPAGEKVFMGDACVLCTDPKWTIERKNWN